MNSFEFKKFLYNFNFNLKKSNRKILLLLDNASCHKIIKNYTNIGFLFLPANTTGFYNR